MADFSHLKNLEVSPLALAPYTIEDIEGAPTIWFSPATDANKGFFNASLKRANERAQGGRKTRRVTGDQVAKTREEDRELLALHCAKGWGSTVEGKEIKVEGREFHPVRDASGATVEFSHDECLSFFRALPNWIFDAIRAFVTDPGNFIESPTADGATLGNSSASA